MSEQTTPMKTDSEPKPSAIPFENIDFFVDLGIHIAYYRRKRGLTQKELADKVGFSPSYLSKIESEHQITPFSMNVFFSICRALDVHPSKMFEPLP